MATDTLEYLQWQFLDSAFPIGGFAHSGGLEAAYQSNYVRDSKSLREFIVSNLVQTGSAALPFVTASYSKTSSLEELDRLYNAFTTNHVANRASRSLGMPLIMTCSSVFIKVPSIAEIKTYIRDHDLRGHFPPLFGAICRELQFSLFQTQKMFLYNALRGLVSSAVRLNIVGPIEGQQIQQELSETSISIAKHYSETPVSEAAQTAFILDLVQGKHDRLYSRLFNT